MFKFKTRKGLSLSSILSFTFALLAIFAAGLTSAFAYYNFRQQLRDDLRSRLLNIVTIAATIQDGDKHARLNSPEDMFSDEYVSLNSRNFEIVKADPNIIYIYTMRADDQGNIYFVLDAGQDTSNPNASYSPDPIGEFYDQPSTILHSNFSNLDKPIVETDIYTDEFGSFLSAYAPFYRSDGTREGVIGVDFTANYVFTRERQLFRTILSIFILAIPLFAIAGWLLGNAISMPIRKITDSALRIAAGSYKEKISVRSSIPETNELANAFNGMADHIGSLINGLEEQTEKLSNRSSLLEDLTSRLERRASQFSAISEVANAIASLQRIQELLPNIASVISKQFGFYHVGIFLVDEGSGYAVLSAANSEGGQRMLDRGHRLKVGETGIVGFVTGTGKPRISLDTASDAVHYKNPDLPDTRSELALPLMAGGKIIGALDVQSKEFNAFNDEDIEVLSTLASQVSIAIENSRLYEDTQHSLVEIETLYRQFLKKEWGMLSKEKNLIGYKKTIYGASPIELPVEWNELDEAVEKGEPVVINKRESQASRAIAVPIKLRNEVVAVLDIRSRAGEDWSQDQIELVQAIADRVAISIENARLFEETSTRAERERLVAEITNKVRSTNDPATMISIAMEELKNALGASKVQIRPYNGPVSNLPSDNGRK